jgi:signal transduction histidine kinase
MLNSVALLQNRRAELPPNLVESIDLLAGDLHRFRRLVVDLLDISRSDGGDAGPEEQVVVADLVRRAADGAGEGPHTLILPEAEGLMMRADKRRLERVVTNLVENAELHGRGCEAVRVSRADGCVRIAVDDRGDGISAEGRERIFDRFTRDGSGRGPGVGLGLAIVARHVHWHGGEVWVENRDGGGARFVVELPVFGDGESPGTPTGDERPTVR